VTLQLGRDFQYCHSCLQATRRHSVLVLESGRTETGEVINLSATQLISEAISLFSLIINFCIVYVSPMPYNIVNTFIRDTCRQARAQHIIHYSMPIIRRTTRSNIHPSQINTHEDIINNKLNNYKDTDMFRPIIIRTTLYSQ